MGVREKWAFLATGQGKRSGNSQGVLSRVLGMNPDMCVLTSV